MARNLDIVIRAQNLAQGELQKLEATLRRLQSSAQINFDIDVGKLGEAEATAQRVIATLNRQRPTFLADLRQAFSDLNSPQLLEQAIAQVADLRGIGLSTLQVFQELPQRLGKVITPEQFALLNQISTGAGIEIGISNADLTLDQIDALRQALGQLSNQGIAIAVEGADELAQLITPLDRVNQGLQELSRVDPTNFKELLAEFGDSVPDLQSVASAFVKLRDEGKSLDEIYQELKQTVGITSRQFVALSNLRIPSADAQQLAQSFNQAQGAVSQFDRATAQALRSLNSLFLADTSKVDNLVQAFNGNAIAANQAVSAYRQLSQQALTADNVFKILNKTTGITRQQFEALQTIRLPRFDIERLPNLEALRQRFTGLNLEEIANLFNKLQRSGRSSSEVFAELARQTGINDTQFRALSESFALFNSQSRQVPALNVLQQLGVTITGLRFAFLTFAQIAQQALSTLVGGAIQLEQQILEIRATIAATNQVQLFGENIADPLEKIIAVQPAVEQAIAKIRENSLELAGVTSNELISVFKIIATELPNIGGTLEDGVKLTSSFSAALTTLGIPLFQARQEIQSILQGQININSLLAKQLGITNAQLAVERSRGRLVEFLTERLQALEAGQALVAKTFSGVTSNIAEQFERLQEAFGKALLPVITEQLDKLFQFLQAQRPALEAIVKVIGAVFAEFLTATGDTITTISPLFVEIATSLTKIGKIALNLLLPVFRTFIETVKIAASVLNGILTPIFRLLNNILDFIVEITNGIGRAVQLAQQSLEIFGNTIASIFAPITSFIGGVIEGLQKVGDEVTRNPLFQFVAKPIADSIGLIANALGAIPPILGTIAVGIGIVKLASFIASGQITTGLVNILAKLGLIQAQVGALGASTVTAGATITGVLGGIKALLVSIGGFLTATVLPALTGLAVVAVKVVVPLLAVVAVIDKVFNVSGQIADAIEQTNSAIARANNLVFTNAANVASNLRRIQELRKNGIKLTEQEKQREQELLKQSQLEVAEINRQIAENQRLINEGVGDKKQLEAAIADLEKIKGLLSDIQLQSLAFVDRGTAFEQLQQQVELAENFIAGGAGTAELLQQRAKELVSATEKQLEAGVISASMAAQRLRALAQNNVIELDLRLQLIKKIAGLDKEENRRRLESLKEQQQAVELELQQGAISEVQALERRNALIKQQNAIETKDKIENLQTERDLIIAQLEETKRKVDKEIRDLDEQIIRATSIDEIRTLSARQERLLQQRITLTEQIKTKTVEFEQEIGTAKLDEQNRQAQLEIENIRKLTEIRNRELQRANKQALQIIEQSEIEAQNTIKQLRTKGFENETELTLRSLETERKITAERIKAQQELIKGLESLPEPQSQVEKEERLLQIQDERLKLTRLISTQLEQQIKLQQLLAEQAIVPLERQKEALNTINKLLNSNNELKQAEVNLQKTLTNQQVAVIEQQLKKLQQVDNIRRSILEREKTAQKRQTELARQRLEEEKQFANVREQAVIQAELDALSQAEQEKEQQRKQKVEQIKEKLEQERLAQLGITTAIKEEDIAHRIFEQQVELLKLKAKQFEEEQKAAQLNLEFAIKEREIRNQQLKLEAQIALVKAQASKDQQAIASAQALLALTEQQIANSDQIANLQRETLAAQQFTERENFNQAQQEALFEQRIKAAESGVFTTANLKELQAQQITPPLNRLFNGLDKVVQGIDQSTTAGEKLANTLQSNATALTPPTPTTSTLPKLDLNLEQGTGFMEIGGKRIDIRTPTTEQGTGFMEIGGKRIDIRTPTTEQGTGFMEIGGKRIDIRTPTTEQGTGFMEIGGKRIDFGQKTEQSKVIEVSGKAINITGDTIQQKSVTTTPTAQPLAESNKTEDKLKETVSAINTQIEILATELSKIGEAIKTTVQSINTAITSLQTPANDKESKKKDNPINKLFQARRQGGLVSPSTPYLVNEGGQESFTTTDPQTGKKVTQLIPQGSRIVAFPTAGRVNNALQTERIFEQVTRLDPNFPNTFDLDGLTKAITKALQKPTNPPNLAVNNNFYNDSQPDYTAYRVVRQLLAI